MAGRNWTRRSIIELIEEWASQHENGGGGGSEYVEYTSAILVYENANGFSFNLICRPITTMNVFAQTSQTSYINDLQNPNFAMTFAIRNNAYTRDPSSIYLTNAQPNWMAYSFPYSQVSLGYCAYYVDLDDHVIYPLPNGELNGFGFERDAVTVDGSQYTHIRLTDLTLTNLTNTLNAINSKFSGREGMIIRLAFNNYDNLTAMKVLDIGAYADFVRGLYTPNTYTYGTWT